MTQLVGICSSGGSWGRQAHPKVIVCVLADADIPRNLQLGVRPPIPFVYVAAC